MPSGSGKERAVVCAHAFDAHSSAAATRRIDFTYRDTHIVIRVFANHDGYPSRDTPDSMG
jgi:hypothetical protein